jgi:hypothetical protein
MAAATNRRKSAEERREEILAIAIEHFAARGFRGTSTEVIAPAVRALGGDAERVARLLKRFRAGAAERRPRRLSAEQALAAYARRLEQLNDAYADIQREQVALGRKLG